MIEYAYDLFFVNGNNEKSYLRINLDIKTKHATIEMGHIQCALVTDKHETLV